MISLQEYLNNKYPSPEDKETIKKISTSELTETLEGGELDLREFKNLEELIIDRNFLTTPLTKIVVDGLPKLKALIYEEREEETEEDKKLWEELGIIGDIRKRTVVQELKRLGELWSTANAKQITIYPSTGKSPREQLKDKPGATETTDQGFNLYLRLGRKDKAGNFCPNLVFWTLAQELTTTNFATADKDPVFWQQFTEDLKWVKDNLSPEYQKEFELLLTPSTFPHSQLEISELLTVYFPNSEDILDSQTIRTTVNQEIVNQTWQTVREELMDLISQELKNNPDEEKLKELTFKATVDYNPSEQEYIIQVNYHPNNPLKDNLKELITTTPLQLEIANLKQKQEQLPTNENFTKLTKQNQLWDNYLQYFTDKEKYQEVKDKINKID